MLRKAYEAGGVAGNRIPSLAYAAGLTQLLEWLPTA